MLNSLRILKKIVIYNKNIFSIGRKQNFKDIILNYEQKHNLWELSHVHFSKVINKFNLKKGAELGVAFGGHSKYILENTKVEKLYGVDSYKHYYLYLDPMNLSQKEFDFLFDWVKKKMSIFQNRFELVRKTSVDASKSIENNLDFVYIDADHSYKGVKNDLLCWYNKIRPGGVVAGHDYLHESFPGVTLAIDEFFKEKKLKINYEGDGVWWVIKERI